MTLIRKLIVGVAATMLTTTAAMAADPIIIPPPAPPPPMAMAPVASPFEGIYFGGYFYRTLPLAGPGFRAFGGQVGYNIVRGSMLFGVEARVGFVQPPPPGGSIHFDVGGRAGFILGNNVLLYGGVAVGAVPGVPFRYLSVGGGAEFVLGDRIGIFGELRHVWGLPLGGTQFNMLAVGINFHP